MCIHEYFRLVLCWEVCPLSECPLSEVSLYIFVYDLPSIGCWKYSEIQANFEYDHTRRHYRSPAKRGYTVYYSRVLLYSETSSSDKGQTLGSQQRTSHKCFCTYILCIKSPPKEDTLSTKDKMACPESVLIKRFHCVYCLSP